MPTKKEKQEKMMRVRDQIAEDTAEDDIVAETTMQELLSLRPSDYFGGSARLSHEEDENGNVVKYHGLTEARLAMFLRTLAETGSLAAAARKATPWEIAKGGGVHEFTEYAEANKDFKAAIETAKDFARGRVEHEIIRRAFTPTLRPVVSKGDIVGYEKKYDNKLLLEVAKALDPSRWSEKREIKHSGEITHGVMISPGQLSAEDWEKQFSTMEHPLLDVVEAELCAAVVEEDDES